MAVRLQAGDNALHAEDLYPQDPKKINDVRASLFPGICLICIIVLVVPDVVDTSTRSTCCERPDILENETAIGMLCMVFIVTRSVYLLTYLLTCYLYFFLCVNIS